MPAEILGRDAKGICYLAQRRWEGPILAAFDSRDGDTVDAGLFGELLLRERFPVPNVFEPSELHHAEDDTAARPGRYTLATRMLLAGRLRLGYSLRDTIGDGEVLQA